MPKPSSKTSASKKSTSSKKVPALPVDLDEAPIWHSKRFWVRVSAGVTLVGLLVAWLIINGMAASRAAKEEEANERLSRMFIDFVALEKNNMELYNEELLVRIMSEIDQGLPGTDSYSKDPWDNSWELVWLDGNFMVCSCGVDGELDTDDDIRLSWYGFLTSEQGSKYFPPMVRGAILGDTELVREAISDGQDVSGKYPSGFTPLAYAINNGHMDIVKLLLDYSANPYVASVDRMNSFQLAESMQGRRAEILEYIKTR